MLPGFRVSLPNRNLHHTSCSSSLLISQELLRVYAMFSIISVLIHAGISAAFLQYEQLVNDVTFARVLRRDEDNPSSVFASLRHLFVRRHFMFTSSHAF